jgi:uncharacterized protein (PEP-CTERM system associated)
MTTPDKAQRVARPDGALPAIALGTRRNLGRAAALLLASSLAALPAAAEITFNPSISVSGTYVDNVDLAADGLEQDDIIWQLNPSLAMRHTANRATSSLLYTMQNVFYMDQNDLDQTFHQLDANSAIEVLRDFVFLDLGAGITQAIIDPQLPGNPNNLFATGNIADATRYSVSPRFSHRYGGVQVDADYALGWVDYKPVRAGNTFNVDDSEDSAILFAVAKADVDAPFTWRLTYDARETDWDTALDYAYDVAGLELGWGIARKLRLIGRGGVESDLRERQDDGGLDTSFWEAGFQWRPSSRDEIELRVGDRSFGDSYSAFWRHRARLLIFDVTYNVTPTTQSQIQVFGEPVVAQPGAPGSPPAPPSPGIPVGGFPDDVGLGLTPEVYVRKNLAGNIILTGRRSALTVRLFSENRRYLTSDQTERSSGFSAAFTRRMSSQLNAGADVLGTRTRVRDLQENDERELRLWLGMNIGARSGLTLTASHRERTGDAQEYKVNLVTLAWNRQF